MRGFFAALTASFTILFLATWAFTGFDYSSIEPDEYEITAAHQDFVAACNLGDIDILGDSTANADLIPSRIGFGIHVLGLGGGTPVEMYYVVQSMLHCPHLPKAIIFEYVPSAFGNDPAFPFPQKTYFWEKAFAYKVVNLHDTLDILRNSRRFNSILFTGPPSPFDIDYRVKTALYAIRFPTYFMPDLQHYGITTLAGHDAAHRATKRQIFEQTVLDSGHHFYGTDPQGGAKLDHDAGRVDDGIAPLTDFYFRRTLDVLAGKGVAVVLVEPPRQQTSFLLYPPELVDIYQHYLLQLQSEHPDVRLIGNGFQVWQPDLFGDESHLNLRGSLAFSAMIRTSLEAAKLQGIYPASMLTTLNLYAGVMMNPGFWLKPPTGVRITQQVETAPPDMVFPAGAVSWQVNVQPAASGAQPPNIQANPAALAANSRYAISVMVKNVNADAASLQMQWPGGAAGKVIWNFTQHVVAYSGQASDLNSGVSRCPDGWVVLNLTGSTGPVAGRYPGPVISLSASGPATIMLYDLTLENTLWPTNYCKLAPAEAKTIAPG